MLKFLNRKNYQIFLVILVAFQAILELDYLIYGQLDSIGLPRFTTVVHLIVVPSAIVIGFFLFDKNKKRTFIIGSSYLIVLGIYFVMHCTNVMKIRNDLYLPNNFVFDIIDEFIYVYTTVVPYFLIYLFTKTGFTDKQIKWTTLLASSMISIPIFLGNIFVFGKSTYSGNTQANIISWFQGIYETCDPRTLASKFFFAEGNTIGVVLFILLPLLYYYFDKEKNKKSKVGIGCLILIHSLSMIMLSTRIATYGSIICAVAFLAIKLFCTLIMHNTKLSKTTLLFTTCMIILCTAILPYCPAVVNQQIDRSNDKIVLKDNHMIEESKDDVDEKMQQAKTKWDPTLVFQFEVYGIESNLMAAIPSIYYMYWYPYTQDAYFWLDLLFNVPFYERVNGRQIQTLFIQYKWDETPNPTVDHLLGLGYSEMMNGSLILEQDFVQQFYSFGYVGSFLIIGPWIALLVYGIYRVLSNFKTYGTEDILIFACALCCGIAGAWMSGHVLDQLTATSLMAFISSILLLKLDNNLTGDKNEN